MFFIAQMEIGDECNHRSGFKSENNEVSVLTLLIACASDLQTRFFSFQNQSIQIVSEIRKSCLKNHRRGHMISDFRNIDICRQVNYPIFNNM